MSTAMACKSWKEKTSFGIVIYPCSVELNLLLFRHHQMLFLGQGFIRTNLDGRPRRGPGRKFRIQRNNYLRLAVTHFDTNPTTYTNADNTTHITTNNFTHITTD